MVDISKPFKSVESNYASSWILIGHLPHSHFLYTLLGDMETMRHAEAIIKSSSVLSTWPETKVLGWVERGTSCVACATCEETRAAITAIWRTLKLAEVSTHLFLFSYLAWRVPVLTQGSLATIHQHCSFYLFLSCRVQRSFTGETYAETYRYQSDQCNQLWMVTAWYITFHLTLYDWTYYLVENELTASEVYKISFKFVALGMILKFRQYINW